MRRRAALFIALTLLVPLSLRTASPAAALDLSKLSSTMRALVANGGYENTTELAAAVRSFRRGDVYYLATVKGSLDRSILRDLTKAGARVRVAFPEISTVALMSPLAALARVTGIARVERLQVDRLQRLHSASVQYVSAAAAKPWKDQSKRGTIDVGAVDLWSAGVDGSGVTLGVADSGLDSLHPDLDDLDFGNWAAGGPKKSNFADCQTALPNIFVDDPVFHGREIGTCIPVPGYDDNGHGTHVSGIATGTAEGRAGQNGLYPGMAPGSLLSVAKVCNAGGVCLNSNVMAGMRYLAMEKSEGGAGADVINMSLGGGRVYGLPDSGAELVTNEDAEAVLVNALAQKYNTLFVISAGNSGPVLGSVGSPAVASQSLAVGAAVADFDLDHPTSQTLHGELGNVVPNARKNGAIGIAGFSSRGPSGDRLVKPDVVAPGVYIVAPESLLGGEVHAGDILHRHNFSQDPTYAVLSGTSMSAPSAAGVAALVASGYRKGFGAVPAYYRLKAALANTAGTKAYEGSVIGLIFGTLIKNGIGTPEEQYPTRNAGSVGVTGTGAGRVNAPAALLALTRGVTAYTPQRGPLDNIHELQPSWAMNDLPPGGSSSTTFLFHGAPKMQPKATITFTMVTDPEPAGMTAAPASWFSLPKSVMALRGKDVPATFGLRVPSNAKPGAYEATMLGTVQLGKVRQQIRIPIQFFVRMLEPNLRGSSSIEAPIWAYEDTDYSIVGFEDPTGDIHTDWTMIPLYLPKGTQRVDLSVYDLAGKDQMDVFVFNSRGIEIDSTVSGYTQHMVPAGLLYTPTDKENPAKMSLLADSPDGVDTSDWEDVTLPAVVWLAVSDTSPANPGKMSRFHMDVDVVGAASTGIAGVKAPAPQPRTRVLASKGHLPATGVGSAQA
ncbi:MAG: S8 family serine peptidase, partial [Actinomycetota bacterium]